MKKFWFSPRKYLEISPYPVEFSPSSPFFKSTVVEMSASFKRPEHLDFLVPAWIYPKRIRFFHVSLSILFFWDRLDFDFLSWL